MNLFPEDAAIDSKVSELFKSSSGPVEKTNTLIKVKESAVVQASSDDDAEMKDAVEEQPKKEKKKPKKVKKDEAVEDKKNDDKKDTESDNKGKKNADEVEKATRTIFVGNLSNEIITSKKVYKEFQRLFSKVNDDDEEHKLSIESIRFRSISFDEALPRKVAYVQQKLHKSRASINAYVVYKEKSALLNKIISTLNGHIFNGRHLRIDSITHPAPQDKQRSVFVGNLDFEEDEESLWKHFGTCGDIEYVRIIRDSKTNMGKGFAYVQFNELQSVSKALLLNEKPMVSVNEHLKKRKLRVTRCKNIKKNIPIVGSSKYLTDGQRTKLGRAKKVLNKAERAKLAKEVTVEGVRAKKDTTGGSSVLKKKKKERSKTGRVTKRSIAFKKAQQKK
ncbi:Nucleolar protein 12 [Nakaseomyces bracarensis]|uniref:Nucleolar protein 12 n=1 Tax=Nakaseomyces bracarensis TaxID=273131 RepID=A0ABR4NZ97_9SACH